MGKKPFIQGFGGDGGTPTPAPGTLADGEIIRFKDATQEMEGTGDINTDTLVNFGSKDISCKTLITESTSVDIGFGITLSDIGGYLKTTSNMSGSAFLPLDSKLTVAGSEKPTWDKRTALVINDVIQGIESEQLIGVTSYTINPLKDQDVYRVYLKFINPVTNFRATIVSSATGKITKHVPSRAEFDIGAGLSLGVGEQYFDIPSAIGEIQGVPITINLYADQSIDLLGDGINPYSPIRIYPIT